MSKLVLCTLSFIILYAILMTWMKFLSTSNRFRAHRGEYEECPFGSFQTLEEVSRDGKRAAVVFFRFPCLGNIRLKHSKPGTGPLFSKRWMPTIFPRSNP
jgi:hypothetical protein